MIRDIQAIEQPLDFASLNQYCLSYTDVDGLLQLNNGCLLVLEIKKETFKHQYCFLKDNRQFSLLREICGTRRDVFFVYATHNQEIDINTPIDLSKCKVKYVSCGNSKGKTDFKNDSLLSCIKALSEYNYFAEYYLVCRYENGALEYCLTEPENGKWTCSAKPKFNYNSIKAADEYVEARFKKSFNRKNTYWLFCKENGKETLIKEYKYSK